MQRCASNNECIEYNCCSKGMYYAYEPITKKAMLAEQYACTIESECSNQINEIAIIMLLGLFIWTILILTCYFLKTCFCQSK
jgi:hypothetical protein